MNNPARMAGVVFYAAGSASCFDVDTVIQPDNQVPILHTNLAKQKAMGSLEFLGALPAGFLEQLRLAIRQSVTLTPRLQGRLLAMLE